MPYYNTTNLTGGNLSEAVGKAETQKDIILAFFTKHPDMEFTPFDVQKHANLSGAPVTSVRRAMTNLTDDGKLIKTNNVKKGLYGAMNFTWRLKNNPPK